MSAKRILFAISLAFLFTRAANAQQCSAKTIGCSSVLTGSISPSGSCNIGGFPTVRYVFTGVRGQKLSIQVSTSTNNTIGLSVSTAAGQQLASAFDEPAQATVTFPADAQYYIDVNFGNPQASGSFTIITTCSAGTPPPCTTSGTVHIGESLTGFLGAADASCGNSATYTKVYKVPVVSGDEFQVNYSATYPVLIEISGPDTSGAWRSSTTTSLSTEYLAPATGDVTVRLSSSTTTPASGSFSLQLSALTPPACGKRRSVKH